MSRSARSKPRRVKKLRLLVLLALAAAGLGWTYLSSLVGVDEETVVVYRSLRKKVAERGHLPRFFVISGRRYWLDNQLLAIFGGASGNSRHLRAEAIDIIVLDVNGDGVADAGDVDIVHEILDRELIGGDRGGIGTYKNESDPISRQMIHFDLRGYRARWSR